MELGAPSARNSCQISCALDATSCSGRRFRSCTANQNLQGLGSHVASIAFQQLSYCMGLLATFKQMFSFLQEKPKQGSKALKLNTCRPHRKFSELNSDSRNLRNWSRPTGSFSASSSEKPHLFTRCWLGSRLLQREDGKQDELFYQVWFSLQPSSGSIFFFF